MGISDKAQRDWLAQRMEPILNQPAASRPRSRKALLFQLVAAEEFEQFLRTRVHRAEALQPRRGRIAHPADQHDHRRRRAHRASKRSCMGMAHRGRLNVLAHVLNKPYEVILSEFEGTDRPTEDDEGDGDVKYHLGYANDRPHRQTAASTSASAPTPATWN